MTNVNMRRLLKQASLRSENAPSAPIEMKNGGTAHKGCGLRMENGGSPLEQEYGYLPGEGIWERTQRRMNSIFDGTGNVVDSVGRGIRTLRQATNADYAPVASYSHEGNNYPTAGSVSSPMRAVAPQVGGGRGFVNPPNAITAGAGRGFVNPPDAMAPKPVAPAATAPAPKPVAPPTPAAPAPAAPAAPAPVPVAGAPGVTRVGSSYGDGTAGPVGRSPTGGTPGHPTADVMATMDRLTQTPHMVWDNPALGAVGGAALPARQAPSYNYNAINPGAGERLRMENGGQMAPTGSLRWMAQKLSNATASLAPTPESIQRERDIAAAHAQAAQAAQPAPQPVVRTPEPQIAAPLGSQSVLDRRMQAAGLRHGGSVAIDSGLGGVVPGHGEGDKIPAKYEPGEFVVSNDMLEAEPGLRQKLKSLRAEVLADKGMTPAEADAKALGAEGLRAANAYDPDALVAKLKEEAARQGLQPLAPQPAPAPAPLTIETPAQAQVRVGASPAAPQKVTLRADPELEAWKKAGGMKNATMQGSPDAPAAASMREVIAGPETEAQYGERVNPRLTPNQAAFHGDGRYGIPPEGAAPVEPPAPARPTLAGKMTAAADGLNKFDNAVKGGASSVANALREGASPIINTGKAAANLVATAANSLPGRAVLGTLAAANTADEIQKARESEGLDAVSHGVNAVASGLSTASNVLPAANFGTTTLRGMGLPGVSQLGVAYVAGHGLGSWADRRADEGKFALGYNADHKRSLGNFLGKLVTGHDDGSEAVQAMLEGRPLPAKGNTPTPPPTAPVAPVAKGGTPAGAAPVAVPTDDRDNNGPFTKTVDENGNVSYSNAAGRNALRTGGNLSVLPGMSQDQINSTLTNTDGSRWSARDNALMAANIRDGVDPMRGTSQARADANDPEKMMQQLLPKLNRKQAIELLGTMSQQRTLRRGQDMQLQGMLMPKQMEMAFNQQQRQLAGQIWQHAGGKADVASALAHSLGMTDLGDKFNSLASSQQTQRISQNEATDKSREAFHKRLASYIPPILQDGKPVPDMTTAANMANDFNVFVADQRKDLQKAAAQGDRKAAAALHDLDTNHDAAFSESNVQNFLSGYRLKQAAAATATPWINPFGTKNVDAPGVPRSLRLNNDGWFGFGQTYTDDQGRVIPARFIDRADGSIFPTGVQSKQYDNLKLPR